ncbi:hypothetical protein [Bradyrhizobium sp. ARR65]|uniref:hypothetical protein n=1 Tax=Bradyrhizobium sp. ARR65 TaxID=1040989 RepID=UPI0032DFBDC3
MAGIGPQIGSRFPVGDMQGYLNLKGYKKFVAESRPEGDIRNIARHATEAGAREVIAFKTSEKPTQPGRMSPAGVGRGGAAELATGSPSKQWLRMVEPWEGSPIMWL